MRVDRRRMRPGPTASSGPGGADPDQRSFAHALTGSNRQPRSVANGADPFYESFAERDAEREPVRIAGGLIEAGRREPNQVRHRLPPSWS
ncbi:MAG: hypothetical protein ABR518_10305 [Actinomycetota bacterium]